MENITERKEEIFNMFKEVLKNTEFKNFMNIGFVRKKIKFSTEINFNTDSHIEKEYRVKQILREIISLSFKELSTSSKEVNINYSFKFIERSIEDFTNAVSDISHEVSQLDFMKQQTDKIRFCFQEKFPSPSKIISEVIDDVYSDNNYRLKHLISDIDFSFVDNLETSYFTSGPIIDLNSIQFLELYENLDSKTHTLVLEIPVANVNFIKINYIENTLNYQREEKLKRIIEK